MLYFYRLLDREFITFELHVFDQNIKVYCKGFLTDVLEYFTGQ